MNDNTMPKAHGTNRRTFLTQTAGLAALGGSGNKLAGFSCPRQSYHECS